MAIGRGRLFLCAIALATCCLSRAAVAMDFRVLGDTIYANGQIAPGDAKILRSLIEEYHFRSDAEQQRWIQLNSPGGNILEGIEIGKILREYAISSLVSFGNSCASACAVAFLGGTTQYATGTGVGRYLEYGAMLGFHGYSFENERVSLINEALDTSRILNAIIFQYADQLGSIDKGWLAESLNIYPRDVLWVRKPRDIIALSVTVLKMPNTVPQDWATNVCSLVTDSISPGRVLPIAKVIPTITQLRREIVARRFGSDRLVSVLEPLDNSDAIDLVLGNPFYLDFRKPILDARILELDRGAGFYFDSCILVRSKDQTAVILSDTVGKRLKFVNFSGADNQLALLPSDQYLW